MIGLRPLRWGPPRPVVFAAVGHRRGDPLRLLLLGDDGRHYEQALPDGEPTPVEPGADWVRDRPAPRPNGHQTAGGRPV